MAILSREDTGPRPQRPAGAAKTGLPGPETACPACRSSRSSAACPGQPRILPVSGQWPGPFPCAGAGCGRRRPQTNKGWPTGLRGGAPMPVICPFRRPHPHAGRQPGRLPVLALLAQVRADGRKGPAHPPSTACRQRCERLCKGQPGRRGPQHLPHALQRLT